MILLNLKYEPRSRPPYIWVVHWDLANGLCLPSRQCPDVLRNRPAARDSFKLKHSMNLNFCLGDKKNWKKSKFFINFFNSILAGRIQVIQRLYQADSYIQFTSYLRSEDARLADLLLPFLSFGACVGERAIFNLMYLGLELRRDWSVLSAITSSARFSSACFLPMARAARATFML